MGFVFTKAGIPPVPFVPNAPPVPPVGVVTAGECGTFDCCCCDCSFGDREELPTGAGPGMNIGVESAVKDGIGDDGFGIRFGCDR